jgi:hypothetical protein
MAKVEESFRRLDILSKTFLFALGGNAKDRLPLHECVQGYSYLKETVKGYFDADAPFWLYILPIPVGKTAREYLWSNASIQQPESFNSGLKYLTVFRERPVMNSDPSLVEVSIRSEAYLNDVLSLYPSPEKQFVFTVSLHEGSTLHNSATYIIDVPDRDWPYLKALIAQANFTSEYLTITVSPYVPDQVKVITKIGAFEE